MSRKDFLISLLWASMLALAHINEYESPFYISIGLMISYALVCWLKQIQINYLKKMCNIGDDEFSKKYEHL